MGKGDEKRKKQFNVTLKKLFTATISEQYCIKLIWVHVVDLEMMEAVKDWTSF